MEMRQYNLLLLLVVWTVKSHPTQTYIESDFIDNIYVSFAQKDNFMNFLVEDVRINEPMFEDINPSVAHEGGLRLPLNDLNPNDVNSHHREVRFVRTNNNLPYICKILLNFWTEDEKNALARSINRYYPVAEPWSSTIRRYIPFLRRFY